MMGSNLIVQYLFVDQGADINARNTIGWTPRMVAEGVFRVRIRRRRGP